MNFQSMCIVSIYVFLINVISIHIFSINVSWSFFDMPGDVMKK